MAWAEVISGRRPGRIALRAICLRKCALASKLCRTLIFVIRTRQRRQEGDEVVNVFFSQGERLNILVQIRILQSVAFVIVIHDIP